MCLCVCVFVCVYTRVYTLAFLLLFSFSLKFNTTPCGQFRGYLGSLSFTPHTPWKVCFVLRLRLSPHLHRFGMTPCGELQMQTIQMGDELLLAGQTIYRCVCVCVSVAHKNNNYVVISFFWLFLFRLFALLLHFCFWLFSALSQLLRSRSRRRRCCRCRCYLIFTFFFIFGITWLYKHTDTRTYVHRYMYVCVCVLKKMPSEQHFVAMFGAAPSKNKGGWGWGKWSLCWSPHLSPSSTFNARNERAMT